MISGDRYECGGHYGKMFDLIKAMWDKIEPYMFDSLLVLIIVGLIIAIILDFRKFGKEVEISWTDWENERQKLVEDYLNELDDWILRLVKYIPDEKMGFKRRFDLMVSILAELEAFDL